MQWQYVITAEQWAAFGAFWGGVAQVGLVIVAVYSARQWVHQSRSSAVQLLLSKYFDIFHEVMRNISMIKFNIEIASINKNGELLMSPNLWTDKDKYLLELDNQRILLLSLSAQCELYSENLYLIMQRINTHLRSFTEAYVEYREMLLIDRVDNPKINPERKLELADLLFGESSEKWVDELIRMNKECVDIGRKLTQSY